MAEQEPTPRRTRQEKAVRWATSHAAELSGVGAPLAGGLIWSPWLALLSAAGVGAWVAGEWRLHRKTSTARTTITGPGHEIPGLVTVPPGDTVHTGHDIGTDDTRRKEARG